MSDENDNNGGEGNQEAAPESNAWINNDGTFGDMATAPESLRNLVAKNGMKDVGALATSFGELQGKLGNQENMIAIPKEGESWDGFYDKMGRPETSEKYEFKGSDGDDQMDDSLMGMFKQYAYKEGMSQDGFQNIVRFQMDAAKAYEENYVLEAQKETDTAQKAIRERFNTDDEYKAYTEKALGFAESFKLGEDRSVMDVIEAKGLTHDPEILDMLGSLADKTVEDPLQHSGTRTPQNREAQLTAIKADPAFVDAGHKDHYKIMQTYWALFENKEG